MKRIRDFIEREIGDLHEAAYLLGAFAFLSQLLGFLRDRMLASQFGAGPLLDTYYAAFRIPDLLFTIISALVSLSVLVPFIVRHEDQSEKVKKAFANTVFSVVSVVAVFLALLSLIISKPLLSVMFPELMSGAHADSLLLMTRIILFQPIILAFSSFYASYIQVYKKFFIYALSPILYNLGIIAGVVFLYPMFGVAGLALGVIVGALLHLIIQMPVIIQKGPRPRFTLYPDLSVVREILTLSIPRTFALAGNQVAQIALVMIAGSMIAGSISVFSFALNLQSVPLSIIGMSYSLAAFPTLSRLFKSGDMETFVQHIVKAAQQIIFWSIPVMVMFIVLRAQIVRTVLGGGAFDWSATRLVAAGLAFFAISIVAQSLILLFVRGYYSAGETRKPLMFSLVSVAVTIISALMFVALFNTHESFKNFIEALLRVEGIQGSVVLMLPLAFSIGQLLNAALLWISFERKYRWFSDALWHTTFQSVGASAVAAIVALGGLRLFDNFLDINTLHGVFLQGFCAGMAGLAAGTVFLVCIKNKEIGIVWDTLHRKIFKKTFVGGE